MKIAVDAMGGDHAPAAVVEGAVLACREYGSEVLLVGNEEAIRREVRSRGAGELPLTIRASTEVVEMKDPPTQILKRKSDSSMRRALEAVREGEAAAVVSAGNTGALLALSMLVLDNIRGIDRPAIPALLPTAKGYTVLLDVGANVDCKPHQLLQFGIMGHAYARTLLREENPTVGLLNVGSERTKGNKVTKTAFHLLDQSSLNFVGNVEGNDIFRGLADVIVSDGFAGNVALKITEGVTEVFTEAFRKQMSGSLMGRLGIKLLQNGLRSLYSRMDYAEYGGAPLLGVDGVCIKAHGGSGAKAIKNAIRVAEDVCKGDLVGRICEEVMRNPEVDVHARVGFRLWRHFRESIHRQGEPEA